MYNWILQNNAWIVLSLTNIKHSYIVIKDRFFMIDRTKPILINLDKHDSLLFYHKNNIYPKEIFEQIVFNGIHRRYFKYSHKYLFRIKNYKIKTYLISG